MRMLNGNRQVYRDDMPLMQIKSQNFTVYIYLEILEGNIIEESKQQTYRQEVSSKRREERKQDILPPTKRNNERPVNQVQVQPKPVDNIKFMNKSLLLTNYKYKQEFIRNKDLQLLSDEKVSFKSEQLKVIREEVLNIDREVKSNPPCIIQTSMDFQLISEPINVINYKPRDDKRNDEVMLKKKRRSHENSGDEKCKKRKEYVTNSSNINLEESIAKNRLDNYGENVSVINNDYNFYQHDNILWDNEIKSSFDIDDFDITKSCLKYIEKQIPEDPNKSSFDINYFYLSEKPNHSDDINRVDKSIESKDNRIQLISEERDSRIQLISKERDIILQDLENIVTDSNNLNSPILVESDEIPINNENQQEKKILNVIFDLDETLVSANSQINPNLNPFQIEFNINGRPSVQKVLVREGTIQLLQHLDKFCNIFFYTNGIEVYANEIINLLNRLANIDIPKQNVVSANNELINTSRRDLKHLKNFNGRIEGNYIIIDDNFKAWEPEFYRSIIISKKFVAEEENSCQVQYIKLRDKYATFDKRNYKNLYKYILETKNSRTLQLEYIKHTIDRINNSIRSEAPERALKSIQRNIFVNLSFYLDISTLDNWERMLVSDIILYLGGRVERRNQNNTHIISDKNRLRTEIRISSIFYVNVKWLFDCYYFSQRLNENDENYLIRID